MMVKYSDVEGKINKLKYKSRKMVRRRKEEDAVRLGRRQGVGKNGHERLCLKQGIQRDPDVVHTVILNAKHNCEWVPLDDIPNP